MTFGFSRDDIGTFLPDYLEKKILPVDPFQSLDQAASASWSRWRSEGPQPSGTSSAASAASTAATPSPRESSATRSA
jgi:hypothetical protein